MQLFVRAWRCLISISISVSKMYGWMYVEMHFSQTEDGKKKTIIVKASVTEIKLTKKKKYKKWEIWAFALISSGFIYFWVNKAEMCCYGNSFAHFLQSPEGFSTSWLSLKMRQKLPVLSRDQNTTEKEQNQALEITRLLYHTRSLAHIVHVDLQFGELFYRIITGTKAPHKGWITSKCLQ